MINAFNLQFPYVSNQDKDTKIFLPESYPHKIANKSPLSIMRLSGLYNTSKGLQTLKFLYNETEKKVAYEIKSGCTCLSINACGQTLGSIVNPILKRSSNINQSQGVQKL